MITEIKLTRKKRPTIKFHTNKWNSLVGNVFTWA